MKKVWAIALCVCVWMSVLSFGTSVSAAEEVMLKYVVAGDGTAQIAGYTGDPVAIGIPAKAGDYTVTSIAAAAFEGCQTLECIVLPDTVTSIGVRAFADCTALSDITLPAGATYIGTDAFVGTAHADDPANWVDNALYLNTALLTVNEEAGERIVIKDGTTTVAERAFINVPSAKHVIVPASVSFIAEEAFDGCDEAALYMFSDAQYAQDYAAANGMPYGIIADLVKDGRVDMLDALILYNEVSSGTLPDERAITADVNCNGLVDMMDCLQLYASVS